MTPRNGRGQFVRQSAAESFGEPDRNAPTVGVDVGRGQAVSAAVGADFVNTVEKIARDAHYGGYFRVFVNGSEVVNPGDSPEKIEAGMRIAITSYDKVGAWRV